MAGRPAMYNSKEELEKELDRYFLEVPEKEWTVTGLALFLGFCTRQSLINYEGKAEYLDTIKKAKLRVEYSYEKDLKEKGNTGTIFALKNFDWKDKSEVDTTNKNMNWVANEMTDEELDKIINS